MSRFCRAAILAVLAGAGCVASIPFTTIDRGDQSGHRAAATLVVRDDAAWQALWREHTAGLQPAPPTPGVDFAREMVIAVFLGERPSGGFAIEVAGIERRRDRLAVHVRQTAPDPGAMHTMALTTPFHLIRLPASPLPVAFHTRLAP